jgi:hypothetical protein
VRRPRPLILCLIFCAVAALLIAALVLRPALRARALMNEIRILHAGPFSAEQLRTWAAEHDGEVQCDGNRCDAYVRVSNGLLAALHLAPLTYFYAEVATEDGNLLQTGFSLTNVNYGATTWKGSSTGLIVVFDDKRVPESHSPAPHTHLGQEPIGKPPGVIFITSLNAAPRWIALAYDIHVWCLTRIGGCDRAQQAPGVWALRTR